MRTSKTASAALADYAAALTYQHLPDPVRRIARDCVIDTVAAAVYGHAAPAGRIVVDHVLRQRSWGRCHILGGSRLDGSRLDGSRLDGARAPVAAEQAALANGVLAHAFELDSLRKPGAGVHPGAVLVPAALAVAQEEGLGGQALLTAIVAGCEVLFRIGRATKHTAEERGFHAPGLTGPFGAAIAAGHLLGLAPAEMQNALGIAGSLGGGLLEFASSGDGGMVKRLHLGRAAAAGVMAARLAQGGLTGPSSVLEGPSGFLQAYCAETDPAALTAELGHRFETLSTCFKAYACHITAHTPVHAARLLRREHGFSGRDVHSVRIEGSPKMAALHANQAPADLVAAQYSIPFCVAAALLYDPADPATFTEALGDADVAELSARIEVVGTGSFESTWTTRTQITLPNGQTVELTLDQVPGMPGRPFDQAQLRAKFMALTESLGEGASTLFERLESLETEPELGWLVAATPRRAYVEA